MRINLLVFLGSILIFLVSCKDQIPEEGFVQVEGGKIWYKIVGTGKGNPLLVLHGGPGSRSCAMMPGYGALADERPVVFYDQLGSGHSDRPSDTSLWKIERFVDEIDILRNALQLDEVHMLGQSCGSAFLMEYLSTRQANGVLSATFSSPLLSTEKWIADASLLLAAMPQNLQDTIAKYEKLEQYNAPAYLAATDSFYMRHLARSTWPYGQNIECEEGKGFNAQIYNYMWGPTEFKATGTLKNFDRTKELGNLDLPVLFITGEYDEARPETVKLFQDRTEGARFEVVPSAAHMTMVDNPNFVRKVLSQFLSEVDER